MKKLNEQLLEHVAHRFKLLGEPMRLRLLSVLYEGEHCVQDLVEKTGAGQANVSKHLSLLIKDGIVDRRKEGLRVFYFIQDESIFKLCDIVCAKLEEESKKMSEAFE